MTASAGILVALSQLQPANDFTANHYLFTYQDGLVRRALVGSVLALLTGDAPVSRELVTFLGFVYLALFIGLGATLVGIACARGNRRTVVLLAVLLVASPQAMVLAYDTGKFDALLLSLSAIAALATLGGRRTGVVVTALVSLFGVLIHEIYALAGLPFIISLLLARHGTSTRSRLLIPLMAGAPAVVAVLVIGLGAATVGTSLESVQALAGARAGFDTEVGTAVVQTNTFLQNLSWTAGVVRVRPLALIATVLVAVPAGTAAVLLARRQLRLPPTTGLATRTERLGLLLVHPRMPLLAALSPVLLFPIGFDWYRWVAMAVSNLLLLGLWREAGGDRALEPYAVEDPGMPAVVAVLFTLVLSATSPSTAVANLLEHVVRGPFAG